MELNLIPYKEGTDGFHMLWCPNDPNISPQSQEGCEKISLDVARERGKKEGLKVGTPEFLKSGQGNWVAQGKTIVGQIEYDNKPEDDWTCDTWNKDTDMNLVRLDIWSPHEGKGHGKAALREQHAEWKRQNKKSVVLFPALTEEPGTFASILNKKNPVSTMPFYEKVGYQPSKRCRLDWSEYPDVKEKYRERNPPIMEMFL